MHGPAFPKRGSRDSVRKRSSRTDCGVRGQGDCLALWSTGPGYLRVLELSQEFPDPDGTILEYCRLIEGLSPDGRRLWDALDFKEFDIGYDRSPDQHCSRFSLRHETLKGIAATGASMALSMYRHDTESAPPNVGSAGTPPAPVS